MIHRVLIGEQAGDMAKALYVEGEAFFPPLSLEPTFVNCFRIFSPLAVITADERQDSIRCYKRRVSTTATSRFVPMSARTWRFAGHPY